MSGFSGSKSRRVKSGSFLLLFFLLSKITAYRLINGVFMGFSEVVKIVLLGIIEGITEWLPISSTGHMILFERYFPLSVSEDFKNVFFVVIQLGAILAVVALFWNKLFPFRFKKDEPHVRKDVIVMWLKVALACVPAAIGFLIDDFLTERFYNPLTIAIMLIVYGIAFIVVEQVNKKRTPTVNSVGELSFDKAFLIGCFQVLAMIPGTSRSGATIVGALIIGISRPTAAEFTFFLAVPTMVCASAYKLIKYGFSFGGTEISALLLGMAIAFVVSLFAIKFLMNFVRKHDFMPFGIYRIALGLVVILLLVIL